MTAAVSPSSPVLPVVAASRYEVVGHLDYSTVAHDAARVMIISSRKGSHVIATVDKTGKFSTMLPSDTYALSVKSTSVDKQIGVVFAPETFDVEVKDKPITNLFFSTSPICDSAAPSSSVLQITPHDRIAPVVPCSVSDSSASGGPPSQVTFQVTASNVSQPPPIIYTCNVENCDATLHNGNDLVSHYTKLHPNISESNMLMNFPRSDGWIGHYGIEDMFKWTLPCQYCEYIAYSDQNVEFMYKFMKIHFKQYHEEIAQYTYVFECRDCWDIHFYTSDLDSGRNRLREHFSNHHRNKEVWHGSEMKLEDFVCWKKPEFSNFGPINETAFGNSLKPILDFSAVAAKVSQLDNVNAPAPWDPLSVYIVDINNSPEQYLKTVEQVVASRPPVGIILLYNMEELDISVKEGFWPNYRMIRDNSGSVARVHNKIKVEELSGIIGKNLLQIFFLKSNLGVPQQFPGSWLCVERDDTKKTVVGLTVIKDEVPESNVALHIAACSEVVRGKMGAEVDIMVYTNKDLNTSEDTTVKDMVLTSWQGTSLFTSTPEIESRKLYDGG